MLETFLVERNLVEPLESRSLESVDVDSLVACLATDEDPELVFRELARREPLRVDDDMLVVLRLSRLGLVEVLPALLEATYCREDARERLDALEAWVDARWPDADERATFATWFLLARLSTESGRRPVEVWSDLWNESNTGTREHLIRWLAPGVDRTGFARVLCDQWQRTGNPELRLALLDALAELGAAAGSILPELHVVFGYTVKDSFEIFRGIESIERGGALARD